MNSSETTVFERVDAHSRRYKEMLADRARKNISYLVLFCVLALTIALPFASLGLVSFWSAAFLADTIYMTLCTYTAFLLFLPLGKNNAKEKSLSYLPSLERWSALSEAVRSGGLLTAFGKYCEKRKQEEAVACSTNRMQAACIEKDVFQREYGALSPRSVYHAARKKGMSVRQARLLKKAATPVRVRPIEPTRILCGTARITLNDAGRSSVSYETKQMIRKPLLCILLSLLLAGVAIYPTGTVGVGVWLTILARVTGVMLSACSGFSVGVNAANAETEQIRMRILFLSAFREEQEREKNG